MKPLSLLIAGLLLTGCAAQPLPPVEPAAQVQAVELAEPQPITIAAYGDSITAWRCWTFPSCEGADQPGFAWPTTLPENITVTAGWAYSGAHTEDMLAHAAAADVSVLVILAGTNDVGQEGEFNLDAHLTMLQNLISTVGAPHVMIMAIPPYTQHRMQAVGYNAIVHDWAVASGYDWFDPWEPVRALNGDWKPGTDRDGSHPNEATVALVGPSIAVEIERLAAKDE